MLSNVAFSRSWSALYNYILLCDYAIIYLYIIFWWTFRRFPISWYSKQYSYEYFHTCLGIGVDILKRSISIQFWKIMSNCFPCVWIIFFFLPAASNLIASNLSQCLVLNAWVTDPFKMQSTVEEGFIGFHIPHCNPL